MDVLWLQEQYARRLAPLHKCLGTDNVADMLTKHIAAPTIRHCSDALAIDYSEGRSSIAQKLHSMGLATEYRSNGDLETTPAVDKQGHLDNAAARYSEKDLWASRGTDGVWHRQHKRVRRSLFTPLRVAQGPDSGVHLVRLRTTKGMNLVDYRPFTIVDDWTQPSNSHRILRFPWIGSTTFQEVADTMTLTDTTSNAKND